MTTIKLINPIKIDGKEISEITLRRPKVRDRLAVDRLAVDRLAVDRSNLSDAEKEVQLNANLSDVPREAIEELDLADYSKIQKVLSDFLSI